MCIRDSLNAILKFIINRKGKQIRPILVLLFAKMYSTQNLTNKSYRGAIVSELIHSATLIHDDIVDDSKLRRGFLALNVLWNNKISVLVGDFLLSKSLLLCIDNAIPRITGAIETIKVLGLNAVHQA